MLTAEEILDSVKETVYGSDFVEEHVCFAHLSPG